MASRQSSGDGIPTADPSALTTSALLREIGGLRELLMARIVAVEDAVKLAHQNLVRVPTETDKAVGHLREVIDAKLTTIEEKFIGIETQFAERDVRVDQSTKTSKEALDAALQAAKEQVGNQNESFVTSIGKSETSTAKQIDLLARTAAAEAHANSDKIDDLKERLTLLEGQDRGKSTAVVAHQAATGNAANIWGMILGVVGTMALVASLIIRGLH
jgi:hypothetical protein